MGLFALHIRWPDHKVSNELQPMYNYEPQETIKNDFDCTSKMARS